MTFMSIGVHSYYCMFCSVFPDDAADIKKSVVQAENRYTKDSHFDGACQEVLNHLTSQARRCFLLVAHIFMLIGAQTNSLVECES